MQSFHPYIVFLKSFKYMIYSVVNQKKVFLKTIF